MAELSCPDDQEVFPSERDALSTWSIGITGASGLLGSALSSYLTVAGHHVLPILRTKDFGKGHADDWFSREALETLGAHGREDPNQDHWANKHSAIVHLAGEPLGSGRWTPAKKRKIRDSRVFGTHSLCQNLARMDSPPQTLLCASAVGYYGARGEEILDEQSTSGDGFLASVARDWEAAAEPAVQRGIRVVFLRFGMILTPRGGALAKMLLPFKMGVGGPIGSGTQFWSWVDLSDAMGAIEHILMRNTIAGPVNVVAPQMTTNTEFADALGHILHRPAKIALPAWVTRKLFGEMADELLLASTRVAPVRLVQTGYAFQYSYLTDALWHLLKPKRI